MREWASLPYKGVWCAWEKGNVADAEMMAVISMQVGGGILGEKHEGTLSSMKTAGLAYDLNA